MPDSESEKLPRELIWFLLAVALAVGAVQLVGVFRAAFALAALCCVVAAGVARRQ
jgi:hypothetical protein